MICFSKTDKSGTTCPTFTFSKRRENVFSGTTFRKIFQPLFFTIFLIAVALAIFPVYVVSLYPASNLSIVKGMILLLHFFKAFKYSIPNILLGEERTFENFLISFNYISKAFSRALGKDIPLCSS